MENLTNIQTTCTIAENAIKLNGVNVFQTEKTAFPDFAKRALKHFGIDYPKFFKMDNLSKLAFLGAELLLKNEVSGSNIALVFANRSSSLDTDVKYNDSISDRAHYFPSPAVFVYTLPNICLGEISIRHQLKSENSFFIFAAENQHFMKNYAEMLIINKKADKVLCGWVEYFKNDYTANLFLVAAADENK